MLDSKLMDIEHQNLHPTPYTLTLKTNLLYPAGGGHVLQMQ